MPNFEQVGSALLITLGFLGISISIVIFLMWWLYRFFRNKDDE